MSPLDEPAMGPDHNIFDASISRKTEELTVADRIRDLLHAEPFAVLCTQGERQAYGSVVAFAFTEDMKVVVFATLRTTRKFRLLSECDRVALVVDNRDQHPDDMMNVEAITATGRASQVDPGPDFDRWAALLGTRHPYLKSFITAPSSALFRIDIVRYFYVTRFQEVSQWIPISAG